MEKLIAIDSGKAQTKAITKNARNEVTRLIFDTKMEDTKEKVATGDGSFVVSFEGNNVLIGKEAESDGYDYKTSKATLLHKLSMFVAMSQLLDVGDTVKIGTGCPIDIFNNVDRRNEFRKFLMKDKNVSFVVNGNEYTFKIADVVVFPESSGIIWNHYDEYKEKVVGVIDIGGLNVNGCIYNHGAIVKKSAFTSNLGVNTMVNELRKRLDAEFNAKLYREQVTQAIRDGYILGDKEGSKKIIANHLREYMSKIIESADHNGWDMKNTEIIFVGGGSTLLRSLIEHSSDVIPNATVSADAVFDNVQGFGYVIGIFS